MRLAPQGITGTSYLEIDYVEPSPPMLPIDWDPDNIYIPSAPSTVTTLRQLGDRRSSTSCSTLDLEARSQQPQQAAGDDQQPHRRDRHEVDLAAHRARAGQGRDRRSTICAAKKLSDEAVALLAELRGNQRRAQEDARESVAAEASRRRRRGDRARARDRRRPESAADAAASLASLGRLDRILGGGEADLTVTIENLRQITDNLRDLTEDAKRYPANVIFGEPPNPPERVR